MEINSIEILKTLGVISIGSFSIVGLLGYLSKTIFDNFFKQKLSTFSHELSMQKEKFKNESDILKYKHQLTFSKLLEERAFVLKDLFSNLVIIRNQYLYNKLDNINFEKLNELKNKSSDIKTFYQMNSLFLDSKSIQLLKNTVDLIDQLNELIELSINSKANIDLDIINNESNTDEVHPNFDGMKELHNNLSISIDNSILRIEIVFKELLCFE